MLHLQRCAHAFKNRADETQEVENNCFILEIRVLDSKCHEEHCETQPDSKKKYVFLEHLQTVAEQRLMSSTLFTTKTVIVIFTTNKTLLITLSLHKPDF